MLANKLMGGSEDTLYVDDVFTSYLRTGTGADATVTTNIDMTKGYMLWTKGRSGATDHAIYDSARGVTLDLASNTTAAQTTQSTGLKSVSATGHTIGSLANMNTSGATYVDYVFRKAPKFFDVVTYTGDGVAGRQIAHSLGVAQGMIIVKDTNAVTHWKVWHRSLAAGYDLQLNTTDSQINEPAWGAQTSTDIVVGSNSGFINANGATYVAYLFAHDDSADGLIQCGSFTTDASGNATVNLGWEPQFIQYKASSGISDWFNVDSMRGMTTSGTAGDAYLYPNLSNAESVSGVDNISPSVTGFSVTAQAASTTYIYLAIRRPNKPPTSGTEVYNAIARTGTGAAEYTTTNTFAPDLFFTKTRNNTYGSQWFDRLRGSLRLGSYGTFAEQTDSAIKFDTMNGIGLFADTTVGVNRNTDTQSDHFFRRAPGFMDEVCDTGTGAANAISHNLGTVPELMIRKGRSGATQWEVYSAALANTEKLVLDSTAAKATDTTAWNSTTPTATQFTVGTGANVNASAATFVTYLFASLPGISKVGSYTGNGTSQTIPCGFTTGARFILIKRTDATGDWYVWDTTRGIVAANDPYLSLNTTAAEVTTDDSVDPESSGFIVTQNTATNINVNGGSYIFLAIA